MQIWFSFGSSDLGESSEYKGREPDAPRSLSYADGGCCVSVYIRLFSDARASAGRGPCGKVGSCLLLYEFCRGFVKKLIGGDAICEMGSGPWPALTTTGTC